MSKNINQNLYSKNNDETATEIPAENFVKKTKNE